MDYLFESFVEECDYNGEYREVYPDGTLTLTEFAKKPLSKTTNFFFPRNHVGPLADGQVRFRPSNTYPGCITIEIGINTPEKIIKYAIGQTADGNWIFAHPAPPLIHPVEDLHNLSTAISLIDFLIDKGYGALKLVCPQAYFEITPADEKKSEPPPITP